MIKLPDAAAFVPYLPHLALLVGFPNEAMLADAMRVGPGLMEHGVATKCSTVFANRPARAKAGQTSM